MRTAVTAAIAASVLVSGCVSTKTVPLETSHLAAMANQSIAHTDRLAPDFSAMRSSLVGASALLGPVGGVAVALKAISDGNELVRQNQIEDPADDIAAALTQALATSAQGTAVAAPVLISGEEPAQIVAKADGARYVVDVQTTSWGTMYFSTDFSHYGVLYGAKLRVIDVNSKSVVAEAFCFVKPDKKDGSAYPTYDELVANGAAQLKARLAAVGEKCTKQFKTEALRL